MLTTENKNIKQSLSTNKHWYVLYVKPKQEFKVEERIKNSNLDVEVFCPSLTTIKLWSDRKKKVRVPLLSSVVLIKSEDSNRKFVFSIPGCVRYLFWLGKPAIVKDQEIEQLRLISACKNAESHEVEALKPGNSIDLAPFGFKDTNGIIEKISNNVCWVVLESLGFIVKVNLK